MKAVLDGTYGWLGQTFGPGEVEIPDGLAQALGLKSAGSADLDGDGKPLEGKADGVPCTGEIPDDLVAKTESLSDLDGDDKPLEGKADGVPSTATSPRSSKGKKPSGK
jgi:hypothetical protein